ncbi:ribosome-associated translation inhibitor RaiA [Candidatus Saccharibacteria bacterium]|nr:MAG: ribosome-associated translation inhibitor RaiA [Candidatus Saccharibacteria bacterium]
MAEPSLKVVITGEKFELTPKIERYIQKKMKTLEKYIPRAARESAQAEVRLKQSPSKTKQSATCDLTLYLPKASLHAKETTEHMYAAFDITIANIQHQVAEYKTKHEPARLRHKISRAFGKGSYSTETEES